MQERLFFMQLWIYRHFILVAVSNDFRSRFSRSTVGILWAVLHPLAMVAIYALVFSHVMQARLDGLTGKYAFVEYLIAGLLFWTLFSEIILKSLTLFLSHAEMIKKARFPRSLIPIIFFSTQLTEHLGLIIATMIIYYLLGHTFSASILIAPTFIFLTAIFAMSIGIILGILNVFVRDLQQVVPIILQLSFWLTPIVYPFSAIPPDFQSLIHFNPLYHFVDLYHRVIFTGEFPLFSDFFIPVITTIVFSGISIIVFTRSADDLTDAL